MNKLKLSTIKNLVEKIKPKPSVFGQAPSLSQMLLMNRQNKKKLFRWPYFWYYYRIYYPYLCPVVFIIFIIVSFTAWNTIQGHLVMGSILSLIGCLTILGSYVMITPWQKHPSILIVYRALTNIIFSINIILEAISTNSSNCRGFTFVTHVTLLASEGWLTSIASDLVRSLTNPFISYKANLRQYQVYVGVFSILISFILYFDTGCQGRFDNKVCWVQVSSSKAPCLWGYYLFWIVLMYTYQLWASTFAYFRLNRGLPATFEVRIKCAQETFKCLASYAIYITLLVFFFGIISTDPNPAVNSSMENFTKFFLFCIANRGTIDSFIWFMLHDFVRDEKIQYSNDDGIIISPLQVSQIDPEANKSSIEEDENPLHITNLKKVVDPKELSKSVKKTITDIANLAIADFDETDLSPQVNMALRQQVVQYVTQGIKESILQTYTKVKKSHDDVGIDQVMEHFMNIRTRKDIAITNGLEVDKFYLDGEHPFKSFGNDIFTKIRKDLNISADYYLELLSKPANERLSEGASGAFMFFCGNNEFIVKTIRGREARVLHQSLDAYASYLHENPNSFLCRFLGSYSLRMYEQTFYFVVMLNIFDPSAKINERYDIKGSWVGRSAENGHSSKKSNSKRQVCRHCNTYYVASQNQACNVIVGSHEANIVLKDNDMRTKIALDAEASKRVLQILKNDSFLLGKMGVLDYSLLVGVKKFKFEVNISNELIQDDHKISDSSEKTMTLTSHDIGSRENYLAKTVTGPAVYYLGIVDFLQDWTFMKRVERLFKIYVGRKDPDGLSVMEPINYMQRFQSKMEQIFDTDGIIGAIKIMNSSSINNSTTSAAHYDDDSSIDNVLSPVEVKFEHKMQEKRAIDHRVVVPESPKTRNIKPLAEINNISHSLPIDSQYNEDYDDDEL